MWLVCVEQLYFLCAQTNFLFVFFCQRDYNSGNGGACQFFSSKAYFFINCTFESNTAASGGGGALYSDTLDYGYLKGCAFHNNSALYGGAVCSKWKNQLQFLIQHCTFRGNVAKGSAGALFLNDTSTNITDCDMFGNISPVASAVHFVGKSSSLHVAHSNVSENNLETSFSDADWASAIYVRSAARLHVAGTLFSHNNAGGALMLHQTSGQIDNCSFYRNWGVTGGAIITESYSSVLVVRNTSFVGLEHLDLLFSCETNTLFCKAVTLQKTLLMTMCMFFKLELQLVSKEQH